MFFSPKSKLFAWWSYGLHCCNNHLHSDGSQIHSSHQPLLTNGSKHWHFYLDILLIQTHQYVPNWISSQSPPSSPPWCTIPLLPSHTHILPSLKYLISVSCITISPELNSPSLLYPIPKYHRFTLILLSTSFTTGLRATVISHLDDKNNLLSNFFDFNHLSPLPLKWFSKT